uniref:NADH dehydrogenase subunit 4L n=1 Tax=Stereophaedusa hemileuca hemileuca TaxID=1885826 RepID=A0A224AB39_9EUPU|nr:NADH dehydrogenase subunit 4L [Stereophaedusa hemileuca hemileuca]
MSFYSVNLLLMVLILLFFFNTKNHFMVALLILETLMLITLVISIYLLSLLQIEPFMFLVLLTFAVCEAGLGLSLLLTYIKTTGSDMLKNPMV